MSVLFVFGREKTVDEWNGVSLANEAYRERTIQQHLHRASCVLYSFPVRFFFLLFCLLQLLKSVVLCVISNFKLNCMFISFRLSFILDLLLFTENYFIWIVHFITPFSYYQNHPLSDCFVSQRVITQGHNIDIVFTCSRSTLAECVCLLLSACANRLILSGTVCLLFIWLRFCQFLPFFRTRQAPALSWFNFFIHLPITFLQQKKSKRRIFQFLLNFASLFYVILNLLNSITLNIHNFLYSSIRLALFVSLSVFVIFSFFTSVCRMVFVFYAFLFYILLLFYDLS